MNMSTSPESEESMTFIDTEQIKWTQSPGLILHEPSTPTPDPDPDPIPHLKRKSHADRPNVILQPISTTPNVEPSIPVITIPSSEFCSLNMRLLERNNEVKLAMETAGKAEKQLMEYKQSADGRIKNLRDEISKLSTPRRSQIELDFFDPEKEALQHHNATLQQKITLLESKLKDVDSVTDLEITKIKQENAILHQENDSLNSKVKGAEQQLLETANDIKKLRDENALLITKVEGSEQHLIKAAHVIQKLQQQQQESVSKQRDFVEKTCLLENALHEHVNTVKAQRVIIDDQKKEIHSLQSALNNVSKIKSKIGKLKQIRDHLHSTKQHYQSTTKEIRSLLKDGHRSIFHIDLQYVQQWMSRWSVHQSKYIIHRYSEEKRLRKRYYNELQELRGNIRVYCRVRPVLHHEVDRFTNIISYADNSMLNESDDGEREKIIIYDDERLMTLSFDFERVFSPNSSQHDVFEEISPLIESVLNGYNVCIFAYGQTGTGKTYTMAGEGPDIPGMNMMTISLLFEQMNRESASEMDYKLEISLLEVYNERIVDLLCDSSDSLRSSSKAMKPVLDKNGKIIVPGLSRQRVTTEQELLLALKRGTDNRQTGVTNMNAHSSRSHLILSVYISGQNGINGMRTESVLHLIDLAGSERNKKSGAKGDSFKEAVAINQSLSTLGDVIAAKFKKAKHVPYRRSVLTLLLKDSLQKDCKTAMIVHVSPINRDVSESSCSLKFASRVKKVELGRTQKKATRSSKQQNRNRSTQ